MSAYAQKSIHIYHSSLIALLQEVQGRSPVLSALLAWLGWSASTVRLESLVARVGLLVVWGVLVTARRGDEIHSAWVVADQVTQPASKERQAAALGCTRLLSQRIAAQVRASHMRVQIGFYAVPEQAFRQVATFSWEEPAAPLGGRVC